MINALRYTEDLEKAGFTPEQARVSVNAWMDLMNNNFATRSDLKEYQFMTRTDLKDFEMKLVSGLAAVETKFDKRCDELEYRLTIKMGVLMGFFAGLIITVQALI